MNQGDKLRSSPFVSKTVISNNFDHPLFIYKEIIQIQTAAESYYRISRNDNLELETGVVNSTCVLGTCQDALMYSETEISDLQGGAKLTPTHILKQVVVIICLVIAAALTAGFKFKMFSNGLNISDMTLATYAL